MDKEKLSKLNELSSKIDAQKVELNKIKELSNKANVVITDYNNGHIKLPDELRNVFFTLLKDYRQ